MNEALETNAILQSEMESKDDLAETVQRLRDETRDLKQELAVRQKANNSSHMNKHVMEASAAALNSINKMDTTPPVDPQPQQQVLIDNKQAGQATSQNTVQQQTTLNTILNELNLKQQQEQMHKTQLMNGINEFKSNSQAISGMTPSVRISALNFVGDALRKVTSIESRLVATRNLMKEGNRDRRSATISTMIDSASYNPVNANSTKSTVSKASIAATTTNTTVNVY